MYFLLVVRYLRRENLHNGRALSVRGFSTFGADIFRGGGATCFWTICLRRNFGDLRYNCPLMRGRAIQQRILLTAPTRDRRRRRCRGLTSDKLRRSSK